MLLSVFVEMILIASEMTADPETLIEVHAGTQK